MLRITIKSLEISQTIDLSLAKRAKMVTLVVATTCLGFHPAKTTELFTAVSQAIYLHQMTTIILKSLRCNSCLRGSVKVRANSCRRVTLVSQEIMETRNNRTTISSQAKASTKPAFTDLRMQMPIQQIHSSSWEPIYGRRIQIAELSRIQETIFHLLGQEVVVT